MLDNLNFKETSKLEVCSWIFETLYIVNYCVGSLVSFRDAGAKPQLGSSTRTCGWMVASPL